MLNPCFFPHSVEKSKRFVEMSKAFRELQAIFARENGNLGPPPSSPRRGGDPLEFIYNKPNALSPLPSGEGWRGAKMLTY